MQQQNIHPIDAKIRQALLDRRDEVLFAIVVGMDLRGKAELFARQACGAQGCARIGFVAIHLRGVEGPIPDLGGGLNRRMGRLALQRPGPEGALVVSLEEDVHERAPLPGQLVTFWLLIWKAKHAGHRMQAVRPSRCQSD